MKTASNSSDTSGNQSERAYTRSIVRPFAMLLVSSLSLLLAQCSFVDTGYEELAASASRHQDRTEILGMWHRKQDMFPNTGIRWSWLFRSDGTGYFRGSAKGGDQFHENQSEFTWRYQGNGIWLVHDPAYNATTEGRISGDTLLLSYNGPLGPQKYICVRVE